MYCNRCMLHTTSAKLDSTTVARNTTLIIVLGRSKSVLSCLRRFYPFITYCTCADGVEDIKPFGAGTVCKSEKMTKRFEMQSTFPPHYYASVTPSYIFCADFVNCRSHQTQNRLRQDPGLHTSQYTCEETSSKFSRSDSTNRFSSPARAETV